MTLRFYILSAISVSLIAGGHFLTLSYSVGWTMMCVVLLMTAVDILLLWSRRGVEASRRCAGRFSNGDDNDVYVRVENLYHFAVRLEVTDEIPIVFQRRDVCFRLFLRQGRSKTIRYRLRPTRRGVYGFGLVRVFVTSPIGLVTRRITCDRPVDVAVYPSFMMLRRYEFLAMNNRLTDIGIKKIRQVGHNTEFEQIKDYVEGDDYRSINWKASARRHALMTNVYQDEKSQQVFCVIDKGRVMQQAFRGMTLLDYSINASLVMSHVAIRKDDKAGLVTFDDTFGTFLPASSRHGHMQKMLQALYAQQTTFGESDFSSLVHNLNVKIAKRSLIILFTNFSGNASLVRQLPYLRQLGRRHRLIVVFFEDGELGDYVRTAPTTTEDYYRHVIAEKIVREQRHIVGLLRRHGIIGVLTTPERLSVDVINKYLELKMRQMVT